MESIGELLGRYSPQGPDEMLAIKRYIAEEFKAPASVGLHGENALVITVASASLANTLRLRTLTIQQAVGTKKRLIFRIG